MTVLTVFAKTSDNRVNSDSSSSSLDARAGTGTAILSLGSVSNTNENIGSENDANANPNNNQDYDQYFAQFDTSSIGDGDDIDSVDLSMVVNDLSGLTGPAWTFEVREFDWGATVTTGDFRAGAGLGSLPLLATFASGSFVDEVRFTCTENGTVFRDNINKTGDTRLVCTTSRQRLAQFEDANTNNVVNIDTADRPGTTDDPRLIVNHSTPATAALSGTITDDDEQDIRVGGSTILLDLSDATWAALGAPFNAERQGIIDGLDSAQGEPAGWDAVARPAIGVGDVVRTTDTRVTITMPAVPTYNITANETIEATIPASAHSGSNAIIATPTFTITFVLRPPRGSQVSMGLLRRNSMG